MTAPPYRVIDSTLARVCDPTQSTPAIGNAQAEFGTSWLAIAGESAGSHLSVATLLRLREAGQGDAFKAASLMFGVFDLSMTPSMRAAQGTIFVDRDGIAGMVRAFIGDADPRDPAISPLYADLAGLPPALFSAGTIDPLVDDSMFMHMRWQAAGNAAQLALYPGGVHGFNNFDTPLAKEANLHAAAFFNAVRLTE